MLFRTHKNLKVTSVSNICIQFLIMFACALFQHMTIKPCVSWEGAWRPLFYHTKLHCCIPVKTGWRAIVNHKGETGVDATNSLPKVTLALRANRTLQSNLFLCVARASTRWACNLCLGGFVGIRAEMRPKWSNSRSLTSQGRSPSKRFGWRNSGQIGGHRLARL